MALALGLIIFFLIMWGSLEQSMQADSSKSETGTKHSVLTKTVYDLGGDHAVIVIDYEGHRYIGLHKGGITHCRSCPCGVED